MLPGYEIPARWIRATVAVSRADADRMRAIGDRLRERGYEIIVRVTHNVLRTDEVRVCGDVDAVTAWWRLVRAEVREGKGLVC